MGCRTPKAVGAVLSALQERDTIGGDGTKPWADGEFGVGIVCVAKYECTLYGVRPVAPSTPNVRLQRDGPCLGPRLDPAPWFQIRCPSRLAQRVRQDWDLRVIDIRPASNAPWLSR